MAVGDIHMGLDGAKKAGWRSAAGVCGVIDTPDEHPGRRRGTPVYIYLVGLADKRGLRSGQDIM
jgi:hypothetical protein